MGFIGICTLGILMLLATTRTADLSGPSHGRAVMCLAFGRLYLQLNQRRIFMKDFTESEDINLNLCTHLIFTSRISHSLKDLWFDITTYDELEFKRIASLQRKYPHLKLIFSRFYHTVTNEFRNPGLCQAWTRNVTNFILKYDFDGFEISFSPIQADHFDNILSLVKQLQMDFQRYNLKLMLSLTHKENETEFHDYAALSKYVDFICFAGALSDGLNMLNISNIEMFSDKMIASGVPSNKMVMKLNFFAYEVSKSNGITLDSVISAYSGVCNLSKQDNGTKWEMHFDVDASLNYLKNKNESSSQKDIVFRGPRSTANAVRIAMMKLRLAGVIVIPINADDSQGKCDIGEDVFDDFKGNFSLNATSVEFPILRIINDAIHLALSKPATIEGDNDAIDHVGTDATPRHLCNNYHIIFMLFTIFISCF